MKNFGSVAKDYAKETYESFVHLPIEFPLAPDGHLLCQNYLENAQTICY